jgi:hypothetical protein
MCSEGAPLLASHAELWESTGRPETSVFQTLSAGKIGQPAMVGPAAATVDGRVVAVVAVGNLRAVVGGAVATGREGPGAVPEVPGVFCAVVEVVTCAVVVLVVDSGGAPADIPLPR